MAKLERIMLCEHCNRAFFNLETCPKCGKKLKLLHKLTKHGGEE